MKLSVCGWILLALPLGACSDEALAPSLNECEAHIAVLASDYSSSTLSTLTAEGEVCRQDLVHSGSRPLGLFTALSGDVSLPSHAVLPGQVALLDRYPNGVLTLLEASPGASPQQLALSPGFIGNPQDLWAHEGTLWISRLEKGPDSGSDLVPLALDASGHYALGAPLPLDAYADPGFDPMPTHLAEAFGSLWVGLSHISRDFSQTGPGRALRLSMGTNQLQVEDTLEVPGLQNCNTPISNAAKDVLVLICQGSFRSPRPQQLATSGLVYLSAPDSAPLILSASALGGPLGSAVLLDRHHVAVVVLGDLTHESPDRLLMIDLLSPELSPLELLRSQGPFELGDVLYLPEAKRLLIADAQRQNPRVRRLQLDTLQSPIELSPTVVSKTGLPPRYLSPIARD